MPRARLLKPGFFTNEGLLDLPYEARLLFAGLWTISDRAGRMEDRPKRIKIELFPADNLDIEALLQALNAGGFIHRYMAGSLGLIHVPSWLKHQHPHFREPESTLPACDCEAMEELPDLGEPRADGTSNPPKDLGQTGVEPQAGPAEADNGIRITVSSDKRSRSKERFEPLTDTERGELLTKWLPVFPDVNDRIDLALKHEAHWKYPTGQKRYVDNWLRNDAERRGPTGRADAPTRPPTVAELDALMAGRARG